MKLSIIIPVYQVSATLRRCLDSVVNQPFRDWQMLLVDDASTDGSAEICEEYSQKDQRIRTIHLKSNSGLSAARNAGLDKARGEYITFVDSDDFIAQDTYKVLMEEIAIHPDYDILEYPVYKFFGSKNQQLLQYRKQEFTDMRRYWLEGKAYAHAYAWNKIYRHDIFRGVRFPVGQTFEDVAILPTLLKKCSIVATTDVGLYYYCSNPSGITKTATEQDLNNLLGTHLSVLKELYPVPSQRRIPQDMDKSLGDYYAHVLNIQLDITDVGTSEGAISQAECQFPILPYHQTLKLKLLHLIGLKRLCQMHRLFRTFHKPRQ